MGLGSATILEFFFFLFLWQDKHLEDESDFKDAIMMTILRKPVFVRVRDCESWPIYCKY